MCADVWAAMKHEEVVVDLQPADLRVLAETYVQRGGERAATGFYWLLRGSIWAALVIGSVLYPLLWLVVAAEVAVVAIEVRNRRRAWQPARYHLLNGRYIVDGDGLRRISNATESLTRWRAVDRVTQTAAHFVIHFEGTAWVIPFRCFESDDHRTRFAELLKAGKPSPPVAM